MVSSTWFYRTNAEIIDFCPKSLPSPGDQSVPAPQFPVHSSLVALSSFPQSHPRPDCTPEPIPLKCKLGFPGALAQLYTHHPLFTVRGLGLCPLLSLPSLCPSGFVRSHIVCFWPWSIKPLI